MTANRMIPVLAAAALAAAFATVADAGDIGSRTHFGGGHGSSGYHRVENSRWDNQGDGRWNRPMEIDRMAHARGGSGHSIIRPGHRKSQLGGFYGGAISAYPVRGNGIYFYQDTSYWPAQEYNRPVLAPKAKIIDVEKAMDGNVFASSACSFEAGVCVIRGGN